MSIGFVRGYHPHKERVTILTSANKLEIDYIETFSPVIKLVTIRMILIVALVKHWPIRQLDVKNAFLHGKISKDIYICNNH